MELGSDTARFTLTLDNDILAWVSLDEDGDIEDDVTLADVLAAVPADQRAQAVRMHVAALRQEAAGLDWYVAGTVVGDLDVQRLGPGLVSVTMADFAEGLQRLATELAVVAGHERTAGLVDAECAGDGGAERLVMDALAAAGRALQAAESIYIEYSEFDIDGD